MERNTRRIKCSRTAQNITLYQVGPPHDVQLQRAHHVQIESPHSQSPKGHEECSGKVQCDTAGMHADGYIASLFIGASEKIELERHHLVLGFPTRFGIPTPCFHSRGSTDLLAARKQT